MTYDLRLKKLLPEKLAASSQITFEIEPESGNEIDENGRAQSDKGAINEVQADAGTGDSDPVAEVMTYTEG